MFETPNGAASRDAPRAVVIGGGATGCAVARDLSLRGLRVSLIELGALGSGTSSRFHGMLQSGARYAVSDTAYAAECMRERRIVAGLVPHAVEPVGGLFVALDDDPPDYAERFVAGCRAAAIPIEERDPELVMREEPAVSRRVTRAFTVPDATINPWRLVDALAADLRRHGGEVLTRHRVTAIEGKNGRATGVRVEGVQGTRRLQADVVVNAGGAWSNRVAQLAGQSVDLELAKGSIIVLANRIVRNIINRCRYPTSHDIIVPTGTVCLFGTTSEVVDDPNATEVRAEEVQQLLDGAAPLLPGIRSERMLRAWAGVRPLARPPEWPKDKPLPRRHKVIDHGELGLAGFFTVCGGSLSTHRSMAEDIADRACRFLGWNAPGATASTPLDVGTGEHWRPVRAYERAETGSDRLVMVCECEAVSAKTVMDLAEGGVTRLGDLLTRTRLGFGPCQGTFCGVRAAQLLADRSNGADAFADLAVFWRERLKGAAHTAWGHQARQLLLNEHVHARLIGLGHRPDRLEEPARP